MYCHMLLRSCLRYTLHKLNMQLTCGLLCLLYFQNLLCVMSWVNRSFSSSLSCSGKTLKSLFMASRELVNRRMYLASRSSSGTLLHKKI